MTSQYPHHIYIYIYILSCSSYNWLKTSSALQFCDPSDSIASWTIGESQGHTKVSHPASRNSLPQVRDKIDSEQSGFKQRV
ncbi:Hypothetical predicted protein [Podarcis lilfordi]|uniref:Uncharacterized protein n=1 Tax=Podarcis lilfordi TaxID=74358 RepID=A0AA35KUJ0_9SAUR|nr:Hypothetical predicted protein [Podarcis lilfordi]